MNEFLNKIASLNLTLEVQGADLLLRGVEGKLTLGEIESIKKDAEIITFIKNNKSQLIADITAKGNSNFKINKEDVAALYELSPLQEGILFHSLYNPKSTAYKTQFSMEFPEGLHLEAFQKAWEYVIKNHTILRTLFIHDQVSIPVQCVYKKLKFGYEFIDLTHFEGDELENQYDKLLQNERNKEFDFKKPPLMRVTLVQVNSKAIRMIWTKHHILWDGWSGQILMKEFIMAYTLYSNNETPPVREEDKFEDYIKYIKSINKEDEKLFWTTYLRDFDEPSLLPFINNLLESEDAQDQYDDVYLNFDQELTDKIIQYTKQSNITVSTLLQGIWSLLLSRYTSADDVVFGVTVSGRPPEIKYEEKIGMFINTIPFRAKIDENESMAGWLQSIQEKHVKAREFQYTSLTNIKKYNTIQNDFFDTIFIFRNFPVNKYKEKDSDNALAIQSYSVQENNTFPLSVQADLREVLAVDFKFNSSIINKQDVIAISGHFDYVLNKIINSADDQLKNYTLISDHEKDRIINEFNQTEAFYPQNSTILDFVQKQVLLTPNKIALQFENAGLTYHEIEVRSNQLANYLVKKGIKKGELIGIYLERSLEMMIGILGIIKAGAAYVPIDPEYPADRTKYILDDINSKIVITISQSNEKLFEIYKKEFLNIDLWDVFETESKEQPAIDIDASDLMYVIYTSGSTGNPKGVKIGHQSLLNFMLSMQQKPGFNADDIVFSVTTYSFDISILEFFAPLISGSTLYIASQRIISESDLIIKELEIIQPTIIQATPGFYQMLFNAEWEGNKGLKVLCGGDLLSETLAEKLINNSLEVWNMYGPTETTIWSSIKKIEQPKDASNIGKAINNTQLYVLDKFLNPKPIGTVGAIFIGGDGLAKGYYKNEVLTNEKFVNNPFRENGLMYETGDVGKWNSNGEIEFLGRNDSQVKVNGYRIELGEIETVILEFDKIQTAAVLVKTDLQAHPKLAAFIISKDKIAIETLKDHLKKRLPIYMIPHIVIQLEAFPQTNNGKLDRKKLLSLYEPEKVRYEAPITKEEKILVEIWNELLPVDEIGVNDNFFEIGGNSLLAMMISTKLKKRGYKLSAITILKYPTIKDLVKLLSKYDIEIKQLNNLNSYENPVQLSINQKVYINETTYTHAVNHSVFELFPFDNTKFDKTITGLFELVPELRIKLSRNNGDIFQETIAIADFVPAIKYYYNDLNDTQNLEECFTEVRNKPFDYLNGDLCHIDVFHNDKNAIVHITIHHVITDNQSNKIISGLLFDLYNNENVITTDFKVGGNGIFSKIQREYIESQKFKNDLENQVQLFSGILEPAKRNYLPLGYSNPKERKINSHIVKIDVIAFNEMKQFCKVNQLLLGNFILAFCIRNYVQNDKHFFIRYTVDSRDSESMGFDLTNQIGQFTNRIPVEINLDNATSLKDLALSIQKQYLISKEHQEIPYTVLEKAFKARNNYDLSEFILGTFNNVDASGIKNPDIKNGSNETVVLHKSSTQSSPLSIKSIMYENGLVIEINLDSEYEYLNTKQEDFFLIENIINN
ncbi:amino acid adenylation domain-containing protein [Flavobacterium psychroterrae]|uniref:Amino acid adenylation domain-containing protein n=1 Tax=Flavobacterium psychroterrae TaxID=2133767 RepID=A0ABS5PHF3_9FLAO|nr:non-ribosomal peptide synthetase [Flavobacterium psychroterrae]MBS7233717.1 amino acid adenylation domain-containing protein [Flavobacterium psychroterrae]